AEESRPAARLQSSLDDRQKLPADIYCTVLWKKMVPPAGLEPARLAAEDFESSASTIPPEGHENGSYLSPRWRATSRCTLSRVSLDGAAAAAEPSSFDGAMRQA